MRAARRRHRQVAPSLLTPAVPPCGRLDIGQPELNYEADAGAVASVAGWDYSRQRFSLGNQSGDAADGCDAADGDARYPGAADGLEPPFATVLDELYSRQDELGRVLLGGFEAALDLPPRTLLSLFEVCSHGSTLMGRYTRG